METINLDLRRLYKSKTELQRFLTRFESFLTSDAYLRKIISLNRRTLKLTYCYNELICPPSNKKANLILVFGNPSPHSIKEKIMFSYEGRSFNVHRVWRVLNEVGVIALEDTLLRQTSADFRTKGFTRNNLVRMGKISPRFNVSMLSYYSFPSASSADNWSGVAGVKKLFGTEAWCTIQEMEYARFVKNLSAYSSKAKILVFQKDAYEGILENWGSLDIKLMKPTRLWYSKKVKSDFLNVLNAPNSKRFSPVPRMM